MSTEEISKIAQKHKKFAERIDIFPYEYRTEDTTYRMAHFYRLTSKLYGSYVYTPYDLSYQEVKSVFYKFILMEEYLKNKLSKLNDYASQDLTKSYFDYRDLLTELDPIVFSDVQNEIDKILESIVFIDNSLREVRERYQEFQQICKTIKSEKAFTNEQLERIRRIHGESQAILFNQTVEQKKILEPAKKLFRFMKEKDLHKNPTYKEEYEKTDVIVNDQSVLTLDNSLRKFGKVEEMKALSYEQLVLKQIEWFEKAFFKALNEDFIKRRVRNPSVQGS
jgi:hypothetical protein